MSEINSRRKLLKSIAAGSGAVVAGTSLPESWSKPVIDSVILPAHAATSPEAPSTTPSPPTTPPNCKYLMRIEFRLGEQGQPNAPLVPNPLEMTVGQEIRQVAWGYYSDAPSTPIYINQIVTWVPLSPLVAHTGTLLGGLFQDSSTVKAESVGTATIRATIYDECLDSLVSGEFNVRVSSS